MIKQFILHFIFYGFAFITGYMLCKINMKKDLEKKTVGILNVTKPDKDNPREFYLSLSKDGLQDIDDKNYAFFVINHIDASHK
jgi:hypothetical protein